MFDEELVECSSCNQMFDKDDLNSKGRCDSCDELDTTPTSNECDYCEKTAIINICGTNLCDDCHDNFVQ